MAESACQPGVLQTACGDHPYRYGYRRGQGFCSEISDEYVSYLRFLHAER